MRRLANLNIGNTFRSANLNIMIKKDYVEVGNDFGYPIDKIKQGKIPDKNYEIKYDWHGNDTLNHALIKANYPVRFITDSVVPFPILLELGETSESYPAYYLKPHYTDKEIENIKLAAIAAKDQTIITTTVCVHQQSPWDLMFDISDLRYLVKSLEINFKALSTSEYNQLTQKDQNMYEKTNEGYFPTNTVLTNFYRITHEPLARWRIKDFLVVNNEQQRLDLVKSCNRELDNK